MAVRCVIIQKNADLIYLAGGCLKSPIFFCLYQDYALQNRYDAETCTLLGHYTTNCGFTTTSRRKPEIRHAWYSEQALRVSSPIIEIKCGRFWTCRKISLLFVDIGYRLCLKRNLKHYVLWTGRSVFDFVLSTNDGHSPIREWVPIMQKGFCVSTEWRGGRTVTVERLVMNISRSLLILRHNTERYWSVVFCRFVETLTVRTCCLRYAKC